MPKWEDNLRQVTPYVPGAQPQSKNVIKLNTNENPYPPSPKVVKAIQEMDLETAMRKYPDPTSGDLVHALENYHGLDKGQIFVGTGSDDVLSIAFLTFFNSDRPIVFPDVTYSFYPVWAQVYGIPYREIPLDESFRILPEDYGWIDPENRASAIDEGGDIPENGGVVIANPNAPTGISLKRGYVEQIIAANPDVIVIVDEAYIDYSRESVLPLLHDYDNLVIVRTFSKSRAMAGLRIGYAMSSPRLIRAMNDVAQSINSYTMSATTLKAGVASIEDDEYFRARIEDVRKTRARTIVELKKRFFNVLPSSTNFVFASPSRVKCETLFDELCARNIFVRHFNGERIRDYLRITIGTDREMDALFAAIDEIQG